jgi:transcriptional regulator with XRE-family HTH domain
VTKVPTTPPPDPPCPEFHERFRTLTAKRNFSIAFLAKALECSKTTIKSFKNGDRSPSLALFVKAAKLLDVSMDTLGGFKEVPCDLKAIPMPSLAPDLPAWIQKLIPDLMVLEPKSQKTVKEVVKSLASATMALKKRPDPD